MVRPVDRSSWTNYGNRCAKLVPGPIDVGWGLTTMRPLVLGPKLVPVITDVEVARKDLSLALLSALCHDQGDQGRDVVLAVERALVELPPDLQTDVAHTMFSVVYNHVDAPLKRAIEAMLMELKLNNRMVEIPPFLQRYVERGISQGLSQGLSQGELKEARRAVLRWVDRAGIVLTDEQRNRIETCEDLPLLNKWEENAAHAKTADDVFGER